MIEVDAAIGQVESLYRALTGTTVQPPSEKAYAPIPAERDPVAYVEEQIERLSRALSQPFGLGTSSLVAQSGPCIPLMSVWESGTETLIVMDLPGVTRDQLELSVQGGALVVAGRRTEQSAEGHRLVLSERPAVIFRRVVMLQPSARTGEMTAQLKDGVLEIRIPREQAAAARAIPVS